MLMHILKLTSNSRNGSPRASMTIDNVNAL